MERTSSAALVAVGLAIGLGLVGGGYFVSRTMVNSALVNTADVKGLAERTVNSDQAIWQIGFKVSSTDVKAAYAEVAANTAIVRQFLTDNGFPAEAVLGGPTTVSENEFRDPNGALVEKRYDIVAIVIVTTANV